MQVADNIVFHFTGDIMKFCSQSSEMYIFYLHNTKNIPRK